ncbi:hypothetical protein MPSEU_000248900 [Mayamaea pseudoterrestris]|nr:hypothetical protein MPSEU_000248900 [Mayamaea pseudoterrestris]
MRYIEADDGYFDLARGPPRTYYYNDYYNGGMQQQEQEPYDRAQPGSNIWPMQQIVQPHNNDILMGRGGKNNQHAGNERLRQMARHYCEQYKVSKKKGKSNISRTLVGMIRNLDPPGRFLKKDPTSRLWEDVGDETAREKASQVLRDAVALAHPELYAEEQKQQHPESLYGVPSLDETAASSTEDMQGNQTEYFFPPTPIQSRYKRARISDPREGSIVPRPDLVPSNVSGLRFTGGGDPLLGRPPALLSVDRRNSSTATAASLLGDLHADGNSAMLSEFDLFNGTLLDSGEHSSSTAAAGARNMP